MFLFKNHNKKLLLKNVFMSYNKAELLDLPAQEKLDLASDLIDSAIVDKFVAEQEWKKKLIKERMQHHDENSDNGTTWDELKNQYGR
jgi:putative addiction module component (TIGR02574 family)